MGSTCHHSRTSNKVIPSKLMIYHGFLFCWRIVHRLTGRAGIWRAWTTIITRIPTFTLRTPLCWSALRDHTPHKNARVILYVEKVAHNRVFDWSSSCSFSRNAPEIFACPEPEGVWPSTAVPFVRLSFPFCTGVASIAVNNHRANSGNTKHYAETAMEIGRMLQNGRGDIAEPMEGLYRVRVARSPEFFPTEL
jgi:hypothetical protein